MFNMGLQQGEDRITTRSGERLHKAHRPYVSFVDLFWIVVSWRKWRGKEMGIGGISYNHRQTYDHGW